ncbi:MAG: 4Fe-4S dicluster domain-containing protein [Candidatus Heimdallarchaeota archaeon]|nr:MAG: 4Fe-4S dicluster domain-containing protein [Candidatus Heimdallarchaeota archaeon]
MQKILFVESENCTGCRICETVCSLYQEKVVNPTRARIQIIKWDHKGIYVPMICLQCETAPCVTVCPMNAIYEDKNTGAKVIDYDLCVGCKLCVTFCPFGGAGIDIEGKVIKCDLCKGDPQCSKNCEPKALQFIEATAINLKKRRLAAENLSELMKKI